MKTTPSKTTLLIILAISLILCLFGGDVTAGDINTGANSGETSYMMSTLTRKEVIQKIARCLSDKKVSAKLKNWQHKEATKSLNIEYYECTLFMEEKTVTVQYLPPQDGVSASMTFFVTQKDIDRWSVSVNTDGNLRSGVGKEKEKTMILDQGPVGAENFEYWAHKGDPMINSVFTKHLEPMSK
ncbi:MAG: hypothetical protein K9M11_02235 [Candidatus Pacebacteria bacterium]|nr:hypothetical protein [Candidatus Paceibacterota bacterium]